MQRRTMSHVEQLEHEARKRRRANPEEEAQRKHQKCDIRKQKQQARLVHTHTDQELLKHINGRRRQAQNAGAEHMKRA